MEIIIVIAMILYLIVGVFVSGLLATSYEYQDEFNEYVVIVLWLPIIIYIKLRQKFQK